MTDFHSLTVMAENSNLLKQHFLEIISVLLLCRDNNNNNNNTPTLLPVETPAWRSKHHLCVFSFIVDGLALSESQLDTE